MYINYRLDIVDLSLPKKSLFRSITGDDVGVTLSDRLLCCCC